MLWANPCWLTKLRMKAELRSKPSPGTKLPLSPTRFRRSCSPIRKLPGAASPKLRRKKKIAKFPWGASGRAVTLDRPEGMTKLLIDPPTERVLGVGIVGAGAGELIAEGVLAIEMAALAKDVAMTIHPHPTLSETVMNSAEVFFGTSTDIYRPKRP